jgi:hypothetical protein
MQAYIFIIPELSVFYFITWEERLKEQSFLVYYSLNALFHLLIMFFCNIAQINEKIRN